jgi:integrase
MNAQELYDLIYANLENEIRNPQEDKMGKCKRMRIPIPEEYGGGIATGYGYDETIKNLINRVREQIKMESDAPTFRESWEKWIQIKEGQERSASTIANYRYMAKVYLLPFFQDMYMDQITPDDIQMFFNTIMKKSKSINDQCRAVLSGIFDRAVRMRVVPQNIMLYKYERGQKVKNKVVLQDDDLINAINHIDDLKETRDIRDYIYFSFLCFTSLRRGEILGLRWRDIDFMNNQITVRNNVTFPNGSSSPSIGKPKDSSFGVIYLHEELSRRIRPFRQMGNIYVLPYSFEESTRPMTKSMFDKMWKRINKVIDLKGATSHSFRASYATMMNAHCDHVDPKVLQTALRHKTPDLAIKVYTKDNSKKTRQVEEEYGRWLSGELAK